MLNKIFHPFLDSFSNVLNCTRDFCKIISAPCPIFLKNFFAIIPKSFKISFKYSNSSTQEKRKTFQKTMLSSYYQYSQTTFSSSFQQLPTATPTLPQNTNCLNHILFLPWFTVLCWSQSKPSKFSTRRTLTTKKVHYDMHTIIYRSFCVLFHCFCLGYQINCTSHSDIFRAAHTHKLY